MDKEQKEQKLTNQQKLEKIIFDLSDVCTILKNNKKELREHTIETKGLLDRFDALIDDLEKTKNIITKDVLEKVYEGAASGCTTAVENLLGQTIKEKINEPINTLNQAVETSKKRVEECTKRSIFADWTGHLLGFTISLGVSLIVSILVIKVLIPASSLPVSAELVGSYYYGTIMKNVFNKMARDEQRRLENMLETTMLKLVAARERIRKQQPTLSNEEVDNIVREELIKK